MSMFKTVLFLFEDLDMISIDIRCPKVGNAMGEKKPGQLVSHPKVTVGLTFGWRHGCGPTAAPR